jgi:hypothetical protein
MATEGKEATHDLLSMDVGLTPGCLAHNTCAILSLVDPMSERVMSEESPCGTWNREVLTACIVRTSTARL